MNQFEIVLVSFDKSVTLIIAVNGNSLSLTFQREELKSVYKTEGITSFQEFIYEFEDSGESRFDISQEYYLIFAKPEGFKDETSEMYKKIEAWLLGPNVKRDEARIIFEFSEIRKLKFPQKQIT